MTSSGCLTASRYAGTLGIPALFPRASFPALFALRGDRGAQSLLRGAIPIDWPAGAPAKVECWVKDARSNRSTDRPGDCNPKL